jgi:site-specific DNA-methyltransferase (adenine-specific)
MQKTTKVNNIVAYAKNAKKHPDKQLQLIARSLKEYGWRQPIVVDKNNEIIVGHGRYEAYQKYPEGIKEPWIEVAEDLTPAQVRGYRLMDNKSNESDWDMNLAIEELKELDAAGFDIDLTGFDRDLLIEADEKDDIVPENAPTRAKLGDLFVLGGHVVCPDCGEKVPC